MNKQKVTKEATPTPTAIPDFFEKLGKNCKWFVFVLLLLMVSFLFRDFLSGKKVFLYKDIGSDTLNGIYPYLLDVSRQTQDMLFPKWSYNCGMGSNIFPLMFRDPFDIILLYTSGSSIPHLIAYKEVLKLVLGGFIFFLFLKELRVRNFAATIGAIMFSFCGFMVLGGGWYFFSFEGFSMVLMLYGSEVFLSKRKWFWFVFAIFLYFISMPVNIVWHGMFLLSYLLLRQYQKHQELFSKSFLLDLGRLAFLGVIGILLAGPFFLEVMNMLLNSPRGDGSDSHFNDLAKQSMFRLSDKMEFGTSMLRFFSNDILGGGTTFKGHLNFLEAPMFYCGLPCLILMPQVFGFLDKKVKRGFIIFIALWCLPILFPYFRNAFWLFTGDYYRAYSFFVSLVFMLFSILALNKILETNKINKVTLLISSAVVLILMVYPYFKDKNTLDYTISLMVKLFLAAYIVLFLFYLPKEKMRQNVQIAFLAIFVIEVLFLSNSTVNNRSIVTERELKEKVGYNDYSIEALQAIKQKEGSGFYRVDKNYFSSPAIHGSLNDGMVQDYFGTSCYHSFSQKNYIRYLRSYGVLQKGNEFASRWASGLINRPVLQSLNSVKYIMAKTINNPLWRMTHDSLGQFGDVTLLRNRFNLPLGYTYDKYITREEFDVLSDQQKEYIALQAVTVESVTPQKLTKFQLKDTVPVYAFNFDLYRNGVNNLRADTLTISEFGQNHIKGSIDCDREKILCLTIPVDKGWHASVDGKPAEILLINAGQIGLELPAGKHSVELNFELVYWTKGILIFILGIVLMAVCFLFGKKIFPQPEN